MLLVYFLFQGDRFFVVSLFSKAGVQLLFVYFLRR